MVPIGRRPITSILPFLRRTLAAHVAEYVTVATDIFDNQDFTTSKALGTSCTCIDPSQLELSDLSKPW